MAECIVMTEDRDDRIKLQWRGPFGGWVAAVPWCYVQDSVGGVDDELHRAACQLRGFRSLAVATEQALEFIREVQRRRVDRYARQLQWPRP